MAGAPAAGHAAPPGWLGVTLDGPVDRAAARTWTRMQRAGVRRVRTAFFWAHMQPVAGGPLDLAETDALALAAAARGIALLPVIQHPPPWAAEVPGVFGSPPIDSPSLAAFCSALVARYGPAGSLWREHPGVRAAPVRSWQVFNEPNIDFYWSTQPFAPSFTPRFRAAAAAIHAGDPGATVVLAGLPNQAWTALASIYAAGGAGSFDAVAVHPYTSRVPDVLHFIELVREVMSANGDGAKPIWVTELSWPAAAALDKAPAWLPASWPRTDDKRQARLLRRTLRRLSLARDRLRIGALYWYTWISQEARDGDNPFAFSGLRRIRGGREVGTPALRAFRRWARAG